MHEANTISSSRSTREAHAKNEVIGCRKFEPRRRKARQKPHYRGKDDMQALFPLHLVTAGVGIAWVVRLAVNSGPKAKVATEPGDAAGEGSVDSDLERSATQWLARSGAERTSGPLSPGITEHVATQPSSYAELELLAEGDLVYLRSGGSVLTALVPTVRQLTLQPLQLAKGIPDAVPTAPLDAISVWLVRRCKQQVEFELLGPHDRRHVLEADLNAPHGVALAEGSPGKRSRWLITPQGLASVRWPFHVLSLQVVTVQLLDARAMKSVRDGLGHKLVELGANLRQEGFGRSQAELERVKLDTELKRLRNETASQVAELRVQLDAAILARHAAEREVAAVQGQKAEEVARAKTALARLAQAESEAQAAEATVRRQQQQIQGMLAVQAEELRTLQQELQIAREANETLKRSMHEKILSLQGALELRDARILELEEENDRMDTVLQVIQAQLGGGGPTFPPPEPQGSGAAELFSVVPTGHLVGGSGSQTTEKVVLAGTDAASAHGAAEDIGHDHHRQVPDAELSLSTVAETPRQLQHLGDTPVAAADEPPLWRSLLDLTGDLSLTALKESLAISRRNTLDDVPAGTPPLAWEARRQSQVATGDPSGGGGGIILVAAAPPGATRRNSRANSTIDEAKASSSGIWVSSGRSDVTAGNMGSAAEDEFMSAAVRMSGHLRLAATSGDSGGGGSTATQLQQQQPQVPGAAAAGGGGVGLFPRATQTQPAGKGTDVAVQRGSSGGQRDAILAPTSTSRNSSTGSALANVAAVVRASAAVVAPGCSPAQLEYGLEATLTLDSLRRRMRQLDAERERLELIRVSLEESLPWRAGMSAGGVGCVSYLAACLNEVSGGGTATTAAAAADATVEGDGVAFISTDDDHSHDKQSGKQKNMNPHKQADVQGVPGKHHEHAADGFNGMVQPSEGGGQQVLSKSTRQTMSMSMTMQQQQQQQSEDCEQQGKSLWHGKDVQQHPNHQPLRQQQRSAPEVDRGSCPNAGVASNLEEQQQRWTTIDCGMPIVDPALRSRLPYEKTDGSGYNRPSDSQTGMIPQSLASPTQGNQVQDLRSSSSVGCNRHGSKVSPWQMLPAGAVCAVLRAPGGMDTCSDSYAGGDVGATIPELEDSLSSSCCSSNGDSDTSTTCRRVHKADSGSVAAGISSEVCLAAVDVAGAAIMDRSAFAFTLPDSSPLDALMEACIGQEAVAMDRDVSLGLQLTEGDAADRAQMAPESISSGSVKSGMIAALKLPGLRIDGRITTHGDMLVGLYDSMDGLCNLGSTRGMPTARGAGWQTARRVAHSRQPSSGVATELPPATVADAALPPLPCSPRLLNSQKQGGVATPITDETPRGIGAGQRTIKSGGSTPCAGEHGLDDDGLVVCDEQVPSPPPAMLLGPLDKLRGAAATVAAAAAATAAGSDGGASRIGGRLVPAQGDEEDEEY